MNATLTLDENGRIIFRKSTGLLGGLQDIRGQLNELSVAGVLAVADMAMASLQEELTQAKITPDAVPDDAKQVDAE